MNLWQISENTNALPVAEQWNLTAKLRKWKCPYCDTVADLSDFEETQSEKTASKKGAEQGETQEAAEEGAMMLYVYESCGG